MKSILCLHMFYLGGFFGDQVRCMSALGDPGVFASNRRLELQRGKGWEGRSFRWCWLDLLLRRCFKHLLRELYLALPSACLYADEVCLLFNSGQLEEGGNDISPNAAFEVQQCCQSLGSARAQLLLGKGPYLSGPPCPSSRSKEHLLSSSLGSVL